MKKTNKLLALLLSVMVLMSCFVPVVTVSAETTAPTATTKESWTINYDFTTEEDAAKVANTDLFSVSGADASVDLITDADGKTALKFNRQILSKSGDKVSVPSDRGVYFGYINLPTALPQNEMVHISFEFKKSESELMNFGVGDGSTAFSGNKDNIFQAMPFVGSWAAGNAWLYLNGSQNTVNGTVFATQGLRYLSATENGKTRPSFTNNGSQDYAKMDLYMDRKSHKVTAFINGTEFAYWYSASESHDFALSYPSKNIANFTKFGFEIKDGSEAYNDGGLAYTDHKSGPQFRNFYVGSVFDEIEDRIIAIDDLADAESKKAEVAKIIEEVNGYVELGYSTSKIENYDMLYDYLADENFKDMAIDTKGIHFTCYQTEENLKANLSLEDVEGNPIACKVTLADGKATVLPEIDFVGKRLILTVSAGFGGLTEDLVKEFFVCYDVYDVYADISGVKFKTTKDLAQISSTEIANLVTVFNENGKLIEYQAEDILIDDDEISINISDFDINEKYIINISKDFVRQEKDINKHISIRKLINTDVENYNWENDFNRIMFSNKAEIQTQDKVLYFQLMAGNALVSKEAKGVSSVERYTASFDTKLYVSPTQADKASRGFGVNVNLFDGYVLPTQRPSEGYSWNTYYYGYEYIGWETDKTFGSVYAMSQTAKIRDVPPTKDNTGILSPKNDKTLRSSVSFPIVNSKIIFGDTIEGINDTVDFGSYLIDKSGENAKFFTKENGKYSVKDKINKGTVEEVAAWPGHSKGEFAFGAANNTIKDVLEDVAAIRKLLITTADVKDYEFDGVRLSGKLDKISGNDTNCTAVVTNYSNETKNARAMVVAYKGDKITEIDVIKEGAFAPNEVLKINKTYQGADKTEVIIIDQASINEGFGTEITEMYRDPEKGKIVIKGLANKGELAKNIPVFMANDEVHKLGNDATVKGYIANVNVPASTEEDESNVYEFEVIADYDNEESTAPEIYQVALPSAITSDGVEFENIYEYRYANTILTEAYVEKLKSDSLTTYEEIKTYAQRLGTDITVSYNKDENYKKIITDNVNELKDANVTTVNAKDVINTALSRAKLLYALKTEATNVVFTDDVLLKYEISAGLNLTAYKALNSKKTDVCSKFKLADYMDKGYAQFVSDFNTAVTDAGKTPGGSLGGGGGTGGGGGGAVSTPIGGGTGGGYTEKEGVTEEDMNNVLEFEDKDAFSDIADYEWAKDAIEYLAEKEILAGVGNGKFAPYAEVTREQIAKILVLAFDLYDETAETSFIDADKNDWAYKYIASAEKAGLVNGIDENTFGYGRPVTREDISVMLYRACIKTGKTFDKQKTGFTDESLISEYAKDAVSYMSGAGIINGFEDGSFNPSASATRAQAAKLIYAIIGGNK